MVERSITWWPIFQTADRNYGCLYKKGIVKNALYQIYYNCYTFQLTWIVRISTISGPGRKSNELVIETCWSQAYQGTAIVSLTNASPWQQQKSRHLLYMSCCNWSEQKIVLPNAIVFSDGKAVLWTWFRIQTRELELFGWDKIIFCKVCKLCNCQLRTYLKEYDSWTKRKVHIPYRACSQWKVQGITM